MSPAEKLVWKGLFVYYERMTNSIRAIT